MVALETVSFPNDVAVLTWDGIHRDIDAWNLIQTCVKPSNSTVWFYQVLARRAGHEQINLLTKLATAVRLALPQTLIVSGCKDHCKLRPKSKIQFLQRLYGAICPLATDNGSCQDIMVREQTQITPARRRQDG